ncbi:extracellular mutant protein 11-domain-containing protein [Mariannaea sp. PMI_226]|nr:extracellular mutant protein 11-domain-containing protein [Mariannaea sp. PMI_226]
MAPSLKDRGGRLQAFARHSSENNTGQQANGEHVQASEAVLEQPRPVAPVLSRQIIDDSKAPPRRHTGTPRQGNGFGQPPLLAPYHPSSSSQDGHPRAGSQDHHGDIFSGSQLGESFMNSGLTTPQNEPAVQIELDPELARDLMNQVPSRQPFQQLASNDRGHFPRSSQLPAFAIGNDGSLAVVEKPLRHDISQVGDGFRDNPVNGYSKNHTYYNHRDRPASPLRNESKLPMREMREVRIRRSHNRKSEALHVQDLPRSSTPPIQPRWNQRIEREDQPATVHSIDDDLESLAQDEHATPKPKTATSVTHRRLMESSMVAFPLSDKDSDTKRRRSSPEYDDMVLSSMTFKELKEQPFDFDPSKEEEKPLGTNSDNLVTRLNQFRHLGEREQHALFANMSIQDWESSGEWFVSEFAGFVQALTEARRNKRRVIEEFENEAASREEAVRLKNEAIDRKLNRMRQDGQRVVEDKVL